MVTKIDKRARADLFRARLIEAMAMGALTQSALARAIGVDRSTISQLIKPGQARLPNAHVVGACAAELGVSADWLLGLSDRPEPAAEILARSMQLTQAPRAYADEQIHAWHREAAGYKIRHVPATLPDMLKTPDMLRWEFTPQVWRSLDQTLGASRDRLDWLSAQKSDYEIALPLHELDAMARGESYYRSMPTELRVAQLAHMRQICERLYPTLRMHLYDAHKLYSAPMTLFGPLLAAVYIGQNYVVFRDTLRIDTLAAHFDTLVRAARIDATAMPGHLGYLERIAGLG